MNNKEYIKWFNEVDKNDISLVGGKGANLGELTKNDIDVPPGFCITSIAYKKFIKSAGIEEKMNEIINSINVESSSELQLRSLEIRELINKSKIPENIEKAIKKTYMKLGKKINNIEPDVAVRSSATAEDLPEASFAGQQDTYLHIKGGEELTKYVKKCWASLWTARAIYYREKNNFNHFEVSLCVVVQKMVNSEVAGVIFTKTLVRNMIN